VAGDDIATALADACRRPLVAPETARAVRQATRADRRDADLAALVRSAAEPGLVQRVRAYRARVRGG
jgi:hypothetical protein